MTRLEQEYAWLHVAATGIIRRLVDEPDAQALLAGRAFLADHHPLPGEYMAAVLWEQKLCQQEMRRRSASVEDKLRAYSGARGWTPETGDEG